MSTGTVTPRANLVWVKVVCSDICSQVTDSTLYILDLGRKLVFRRETIVDRNDERTNSSCLSRSPPDALSPPVQPPP
jgi:hypothetical protein